jgi:hypothetical protein
MMEKKITGSTSASSIERPNNAEKPCSNATKEERKAREVELALTSILSMREERLSSLYAPRADT